MLPPGAPPPRFEKSENMKEFTLTVHGNYMNALIAGQARAEARGLPQVLLLCETEEWQGELPEPRDTILVRAVNQRDNLHLKLEKTPHHPAQGIWVTAQGLVKEVAWQKPQDSVNAECRDYRHSAG